MKVEIVKATLKTFWYAKYKGKTFEVTESKLTCNTWDWCYAERYELILPGESLRSFIRKDDSIEIK